uniref:Nudix hydrolase domain-containing protein n=1 Tax=viral metagenome TaxID=1070528 RepID=A0A6C0ELM0_9ZZZZ
MLSPASYLSAIKLTQVVSIDLVVRDNKGNVLLGKRRNRPAQGYYFVPGGRVFKNESIQDGLARVVHSELGYCDYTANFRCISDHIYEDNFLNAVDNYGKSVPTHYVCVAFDLVVLGLEENVFKIQHEDIKWMTEKELMGRDDVHKYTKYYFDVNAPNRIN